MQLKNLNKKLNKLNLQKVLKRLIEVLELDEFAEICDMCRKKTDKNSEYLQVKEYKALISKKQINDDNILKVENHTYPFKKDILYTSEELKQFELDYQEIIAQLTITADEISLKTEDADLISFFDKLYQVTNPKSKTNKTNNNNKKKLISLCYFLASINNKYINRIKANIGSYLESSEASASSINILANIGLSVF
ncbi:hypothetical protein GLOIN_2v1782579 [Rhizophagus clarus]|uniref:Uncharacterized protein n=1 Tax=Rhizophagus clarus TaxID=94130 RepID=A0A8H3M1F6_9GLOM|nr:hypothetical protein GLOIN_2v1782579 [Rhizophagus clarus]